MVPFNPLMNYANNLLDSPDFFSREIASRALVLSAGVPLEIFVLVENILKLHIDLFSFVMKQSITIINLPGFSKSLQQFGEGLPGLQEVIATAYKIVGYVFGILCTAVLGPISPGVNFYFHVASGLVEDEKKNAEARLREEERIKWEKESTEILESEVDKRLRQACSGDFSDLKPVFGEASASEQLDRSFHDYLGICGDVDEYRVSN